ncbi:hypothetical protein [Nocardia sp. NRRL S-836]|uniref:hypothetical protein n=1 Tax=Nocardia sp. NRRL S-836 TaxID=1519492 RepID=UPI0006AEA809|nr:hypothetical protein [Nocardia sp. NRRL S-836]KOV89985.1 hypothetical protein ADL03_00965 [Nocardia sp. NRRL S-836]
MSNLERRYRRLLGVLPRWYRRDREEEMVGIFLAERTDELDLEHSWPGWAETWSTLGLAVRTHLAAGAALTRVPDGARWRGEVVRALGVLGLLLGVFYAGAAITGLVLGEVTWVQLFELAPIAAFVLLLAGERTPAKVAAGLVVVPVAVALVDQAHVLVWAAFQVPWLVTFACLCLGFHREAPTPPARRLAWWGGGAVVLGLAAGLATGAGLLAVVLLAVVVRVVAFVRGDVVLGRALAVFAVLMLGPVAVLAQGEVAGFAVGAAVVLVLSAVAPMRRRAVGLGVS